MKGGKNEKGKKDETGKVVFLKRKRKLIQERIGKKNIENKIR